MSDITINVEGLSELISKLDRLPQQVTDEMHNAMRESLNILHENVPPYIAQVVPPEVYQRTGTLGRSLGSSMGGGKSGTPTVYSVTGTGKNMVGTFGTNLNYAQYVVDPERQAYMHRPGYKGRPGWWTMKDIKERAEDKIVQLWNKTISAIIRKLGL